MLAIIFLIVALILLCCGAWKAALCLLGVMLIDILILLVRVGARATLEDGVLTLKVIAGPVKLQILPKGEEKAKKPKKPKPEKKKEPEPEETEEPAKPKPKSKITMDLISTVLGAVGELLGRLRRRLAVDKLTLHYTVAAKDPYSAAMTFGYASAGINALMPVLENTFRIRDRDVGAAVDFDITEPVIYADAQLTLAVWEIEYIALAVVPVVKALLAGSKQGKVEENGQASDQ